MNDKARFLNELKYLLSEEQNIISDEELSHNLHFAHDASQAAKPNPLAIVFPKSASEVASIIKLCRKFNIGVVASGGRSGYCGGANAENKELVISLEKMNRVIEINPTSYYIKCEAGVITDELARNAEEAGLYYPVKFAASASSHIAGNIASNAGGIHVVRYGSTRNWVLALKVVTGNGDLLTLGSDVIKDNTGYDLKQLIIGSEGTLAIIVEVTMRLTEPPKDTMVILLAHDSLEQVVQLYSKVKSSPFVLHAFEFFCKHSLSNVVEASKMTTPFSAQYAFHSLIEFEINEKEEALEQFLLEIEPLYSDAVYSEANDRKKELWKYRERISESIGTLHRVYKYDISLPQAKMNNFLQYWLDSTFVTKDNINYALFGHIGDGNLHFNLLKPESLSDETFLKKCNNEIDNFVYSYVTSQAGSISAEHGIGLLKRKSFLKYSDPQEITLMEKIKRTFDSDNIMNRGKVF